MKIGLIIQGPLLSYGKTGKTMFYTPIQLVKNNNSMINYNCVENVQNLIKNSEKNFYKTLLVTWEDENNLYKDFESDQVIALKEEKNFDGKAPFLSGPRKWNNFLKQAKTVYEGILELEKLGCDYIVKTRTDLELDPELLYELSIDAFKENKILINNGLRNGTRYLEVDDLILGTDTETMKIWWGSILKYKFFDGAHGSIMRGLIWSLYGLTAGINIKDYFASDLNNSSKSIYIKAVDLWENKFFVIPNKFWLGVLFRGEQVNSDYYNFEHQKPQYGYNSQTDIILLMNSLIGKKWMLKLIEGVLKKWLLAIRYYKLQFKFYLIPSIKFKFLKLFKSKK